MDKMFDMKPRKFEYIDQWNSIVFQETKEFLSQNLYDPSFRSQLREKSTLMKEICDIQDHEYREKFGHYESDYGDDDGSLEESSEEKSSEEKSSDEQSSEEEKNSEEESSEEESSEEEISGNESSEETSEKKKS